MKDLLNRNRSQVGLYPHLPSVGPMLARLWREVGRFPLHVNAPAPSFRLLDLRDPYVRW